MIKFIIILYLIVGIIYAFRELKKHKKWKSKYDPNNTSPVVFTLGDYIGHILLWIFMLPLDIKL